MSYTETAWLAHIRKNPGVHIVGEPRQTAQGQERAPRRGYAHGKQGIRADLGIYVRSAWEANVARYLTWLKSLGSIARWEYEPETFVFEAITVGPGHTPQISRCGSGLTARRTTSRSKGGWMPAAVPNLPACASITRR